MKFLMGVVNMPVKDLLTALDNRDRRQDKKVVLHAVIKHLEQECLRVRSPSEERDLAPLNVFYLFRDYIVAK
jgi:hypothetical protein